MIGGTRFAPSRRGVDAASAARQAAGCPGGARTRAHPLDLLALELGIDPEHLDRAVSPAVVKLVHADDDRRRRLSIASCAR